MNRDLSLRTLAARVTSADSSTATDFRRQFKPEVIRIVRRALRPGSATTALSRRIQAEAGRCLAPGTPLAAQVANRLCDEVIGKLAREPALSCRETVRD